MAVKQIARHVIAWRVLARSVPALLAVVFVARSALLVAATCGTLFVRPVVVIAIVDGSKNSVVGSLNETDKEFLMDINYCNIRLTYLEIF